MHVELLLLLAMPGIADDPVTRAVVCAEVGFSRAAENRDKVAFLSFVDPDARFVTGRVSRGREEIGAAWAGVFRSDGPRMRWRPRVVEVTADGRLALSRGPYRSIRIDENGETTERWGSYVSTWRRNDDGKWRVVFDTEGYFPDTPTERDIEILESEPDCP